MDAYTLQEQLDDVRVRLLESLAPLPDEALLAENAVGTWSIAEVLAHFVNWEAELVTALNKLDQEKEPGRLLAAMGDREGFNSARAAEMKGRDLDRIFDDLQGVRNQLEEWLEEFSEKELEDRSRYPALQGRALWQLIAENSFEHEASHIPEIEGFSQRWAISNPDTISIDDIDVTDNGDPR